MPIRTDGRQVHNLHGGEFPTVPTLEFDEPEGCASGGRCFGIDPRGIVGPGEWVQPSTQTAAPDVGGGESQPALDGVIGPTAVLVIRVAVGARNASAVQLAASDHPHS